MAISKNVDNFLIVADNSKVELESYKILRYSDSPIVFKRMMTFKGKVLDVNVKRNTGILGLNLLIGRNTVWGSVDLDKVRETGVPEDLLMTLKEGMPSVKVAWADDFDDLPIGVKEHPLFGEAFRTAYSLREMTLDTRERLKQLMLSDKQIKDLESQSKFEFFAKISEVMKATQESTISKAKVDAEKASVSEGGGLGV